MSNKEVTPDSCKNCGAVMPGTGPHSHCPQCPPWRDGCGQMVTTLDLCACWEDAEPMDLLDVHLEAWSRR